MSKARSREGKGKGWHRQSPRHRKARKYGKAGAPYATKTSKRMGGNWRYPKDVFSDKKSLKNKNFKQLKERGVFLRYQGDSDKDGVKNIKDCKPLDAKRQGRLHDMQIKILKKIEERQEQRRLAEIKKLEDLKEKQIGRAHV